MTTARSYILDVSIFICRITGVIYSGIHLTLFKLGLLSISPVIKNAPGGLYYNLRQIWFVRCFRRIVSVMVRSPLSRYVLQLISITETGHITPGTVIVSCHTPWSRLIARWCSENYNYRFIGWGPWVKRTTIARSGTGFREIRQLVAYLRSGGRVIIMGDVFNKADNCPAGFLNRNENVSVFPVRLAKAAQAMLVTQIPSFKRNRIHAIEGPQFNFRDDTRSDTDCKIIKTILSFIENEIRQNPSVWLGYIRGSLSANHT